MTLRAYVSCIPGRVSCPAVCVSTFFSDCILLRHQPSPHNANLAAKGVVGLSAYAKILETAGNTTVMADGPETVTRP
jgi:hypothetical protein